MKLTADRQIIADYAETLQILDQYLKDALEPFGLGHEIDGEKVTILSRGSDFEAEHYLEENPENPSYILSPAKAAELVIEYLAAQGVEADIIDEGGPGHDVVLFVELGTVN